MEGVALVVFIILLVAATKKDKREAVGKKGKMEKPSDFKRKKGKW